MPISIEQYLSTVYEPDCDFVEGTLEERNAGLRTHARMQAEVGSFLLTHYGADGFEVFIALRIRVTASMYRIPDLCLTVGDPGEEVLTKAPLLCIEILSPEDRMSRIETRINDYLAMGVPYVWVIDPYTRQAFTATSAEELREVKSGVLRTADPVIELPLSGMWG